MVLSGVIMKSLSGFYYVDTSEGLVSCKAKGKFRHTSVTPLVGDRVSITVNPMGESVIDEIMPRKNSFVKPPVANIDIMVILASAVIPVSSPFLIDRMTVLAFYNSCTPIICINKTDLDKGDMLYDIYSRSGIKTIRTSSVTGEGLDELQNAIAGKISAFTGNSGVGKSSILNALDPNLSIKTGEVSEKLGRGRHTTRHAELFKLPCGAIIADTPGFSSFDAEMMRITDSEQLAGCFPEFKPFIGKCRFDDCKHIKEPGCAVLEAVGPGIISESRHRSYAALYEQVSKYKEWEHK